MNKHPTSGDDVAALPQPRRAASTSCPTSSRWRAVRRASRHRDGDERRFGRRRSAMFCAMVLDSLDGRVARMTNTQSAFGEQMDSLRHGLLRCRTGADRLRVGALGHGQAGAGSRLRLLRPAALRWRASTSTSAWSTSASSRACRARPRRRWWAGFIWLMDDNGYQGFRAEGRGWAGRRFSRLFGLTMVTNVPFYSFRTSAKRSGALHRDRRIALGFALAATSIRRPCCSALRGLRSVGLRCTPTASARAKRGRVIATSTDEPDEEGLHAEKPVLDCAPDMNVP